MVKEIKVDLNKEVVLPMRMEAIFYFERRSTISSNTQTDTAQDGLFRTVEKMHLSAC